MIQTPFKPLSWRAGSSVNFGRPASAPLFQPLEAEILATGAISRIGVLAATAEFGGNPEFFAAMSIGITIAPMLIGMDQIVPSATVIPATRTSPAEAFRMNPRRGMGRSIRQAPEKPGAHLRDVANGAVGDDTEDSQAPCGRCFAPLPRNAPYPTSGPSMSWINRDNAGPEPVPIYS